MKSAPQLRSQRAWQNTLRDRVGSTGDFAESSFALQRLHRTPPRHVRRQNQWKTRCASPHDWRECAPTCNFDPDEVTYPNDEVTYPNDDLQATLGPERQWTFTRKDGMPYW